MKTIDKHNPKSTSKKQGNMPMLPSGISNFHELITHRDENGEAYLFVDKSLFIRDFLNAGEEATLITRPRRFGKTLTLSMLQHFLAAEVRGKKTKGLFNGLKISQHPKIMKKQGQYPVIFLTLKDAKGKTYQKIFGLIKRKIRELYQAHRYLLVSDKLFPDEKKDIQEILDEVAKDEKYKNSLYALSKYLYQHTGKKVYILLDEYDTPINNAYVNRCYKACRSFLASLFGHTFKGNDFLASGLITGILQIANPCLFSGLNSLKEYTMLDDARYMHYFGFTEAETDDLIARAKLPQKAHELKEMYNGYNIGGYTLYNPFSIVSFISSVLLRGEARMEDALKPYWVNTGGSHLIGEMISNNLIELRQDLATLLHQEPIQTQIDEHVVYDPNLRHNTIGFWSLLLLSGYVKSVGRSKNAPGQNIHTICFPNEEIRENMRELILQVTFGRESTQELLQAMVGLVRGQVDFFVRFVKRYIGSALSYFDSDKEEKEKPYHMLMLGLVAFFANTHHIRSNRESGDGRYDIGLQPKAAHKDMKAIIIEIKVADERENLKQVAKKAFQQIKKKDYKADMEARGVTNFVLLGMAFSGKAVEVVHA